MHLTQVTRAFGSSMEVVVKISVAEVHSGTLRMAPAAMKRNGWHGWDLTRRRGMAVGGLSDDLA